MDNFFDSPILQNLTPTELEHLLQIIYHPGHLSWEMLPFDAETWRKFDHFFTTQSGSKTLAPGIHLAEISNQLIEQASPDVLRQISRFQQQNLISLSQRLSLQERSFEDKIQQIHKLNQAASAQHGTQFFLTQLTKLLSDALQVNRASIWRYEKTPEQIVCLDMFDKTDFKHSSGQVVSQAAYPAYFEVLTTQLQLKADNALTHPATNAMGTDYLTPLHITALLDVPFFVEGQLAGCICFEHQHTVRQWLPDEIYFATSVCSIIALQFEQSKVREAQMALEEKQQEILTQNEELMQSQEEINSQRDYIEQKNKELETINQQLKAKESILTKAYEKIKANEAKLVETISIVEEQKAEMLAQNEELSQSQEEINSQREYIEQKNRELEISNQQLKAKESILEKAYNKLKENEANLLAAKRDLEEKQNEVLTQNEELLQSQEEISSQREFIEEKNKELELINQQLRAKETILEKAYNKLKENEANLLAAKRDLEEKQQEILTQNEELMQSQEEISSQREYIERKNTELEKVNLRLQSNEKVLQKAYEKIKRSEEEAKQINQQLSEQYNKINSSIRAALTIQQAILPSKDKIKAILPEHFLLYLPKDVVSGDFYWLSFAGAQKGKIIIAIADCTGHGVPGAFMTMIGTILLDKIVLGRDITSPAEVLNTLHHEIRTILRQEETLNNSGMDISIVSFEYASADKTEVKMVFSGAKTQLFFQNNQHTSGMQVLKGTRKSIGGIQNEQVVFTEEAVLLARESRVYMFTDGLCDQNNLKRKRFGEQKLMQIFEETAQQPLAVQETMLLAALDAHMQDTTQRDDMLVLGVKI